MSNVKDPRWIHLKGWLFLLIGVMTVTLILIEVFSWRIAALLALAIWAFCRFYYYAFYVIEKYVDGRFRFAGLGSFVAWLVRPRSRTDASAGNDQLRLPTNRDDNHRR